ncbi:hypothetical protein ADUPG1_006001, partial [Aduncisulcus paluster]
MNIPLKKYEDPHLNDAATLIERMSEAASKKSPSTLSAYTSLIPQWLVPNSNPTQLLPAVSTALSYAIPILNPSLDFVPPLSKLEDFIRNEVFYFPYAGTILVYCAINASASVSMVSRAGTLAVLAGQFSEEEVFVKESADLVIESKQEAARQVARKKYAKYSSLSPDKKADSRISKGYICVVRDVSGAMALCQISGEHKNKQNPLHVHVALPISKGFTITEISAIKGRNVMFGTLNTIPTMVTAGKELAQQYRVTVRSVCGSLTFSCAGKDLLSLCYTLDSAMAYIFDHNPKLIDVPSDSPSSSTLSSLPSIEGPIAKSPTISADIHPSSNIHTREYVYSLACCEFCAVLMLTGDSIAQVPTTTTVSITPIVKKMCDEICLCVRECVKGEKAKQKVCEVIHKNIHKYTS